MPVSKRGLKRRNKRKKQKLEEKRRRREAPLAFAVGERVRARRGATDPDFPDMPLGGWAGTVSDIDRSVSPPLVLVEWNQFTLEHVHPVFLKRCERDGLEREVMWLRADDLEPDDGTPRPMEEPTIVERPLTEDNEEDRVRSAFGLGSDDPLPGVDEATLVAYHGHLAARLSFPFRATCEEETEPYEITEHSITVTGLLEPDEYDCTEFYGLMCDAREGRRGCQVVLGKVEVSGDGPNAGLVDDYRYWFWNHR